MVYLIITSVLVLARYFHKAVMNAVEEYDHAPVQKTYRGYTVDYHRDFKRRENVK
jgi:hypothetical protein